jgi:hypothetical protein
MRAPHSLLHAIYRPRNRRTNCQRNGQGSLTGGANCRGVALVTLQVMDQQTAAKRRAEARAAEKKAAKAAKKKKASRSIFHVRLSGPRTHARTHARTRRRV